MNHDDAMARQQMMCAMSDDPDMWRRPPFADIYGACLSAKYSGDDDGELAIMSIPF